MEMGQQSISPAELGAQLATDFNSYKSLTTLHLCLSNTAEEAAIFANLVKTIHIPQLQSFGISYLQCACENLSALLRTHSTTLNTARLTNITLLEREKDKGLCRLLNELQDDFNLDWLFLGRIRNLDGWLKVEGMGVVYESAEPDEDGWIELTLYPLQTVIGGDDICDMKTDISQAIDRITWTELEEDRG